MARSTGLRVRSRRCASRRSRSRATAARREPRLRRALDVPDVRQDVEHGADPARGVRRARPARAPLPATWCSARRSCSPLILIPLGVLVEHPVRVAAVRARDGVGAARGPAAPAPGRRPRADADAELEAASGVAVLGTRRSRTSADIPQRRGQPAGDARHVRRPVRARGDGARGRRGGRVGAAADHRQRGRGAARADLARDGVRVHRHRGGRGRAPRAGRARASRSPSRSSGCASAARARSRRCSSSSPSARRGCSSSAPTATGSSGAPTRS